MSPLDRDALRRQVVETGRVDVDPRDHRIGVARRGEDSFAVLNGGTGWDMTEVLNRDGEWEMEPRASDRGEDFLARARWTLDEALDQADRLVGGEL